MFKRADGTEILRTIGTGLALLFILYIGIILYNQVYDYITDGTSKTIYEVTYEKNPFNTNDN